MSDNYAVINGKRIKLTDEQVKALGIKRKNPFERVAKSEMYCYIDSFDEVHCVADGADQDDDMSFECSNYFNDEDFAKQVALHQLLYRKLLKFAYDNGFEDTADWDGDNTHWVIGYNKENDTFAPDWYKIYKMQGVYFSSAYGANGAIKEVVEPFVKEYPDFVW